MSSLERGLVVMSTTISAIGDNTSMTVLTQTFAAALFDNDGTLIDSTESVRRSWGRWAIEYGVDPDRLTGFHGVPAAAIVAQVLPDRDHEVALARIVALEEADTEGILALPGAARALHAVAARGAVVTSATRSLGMARLEAAKLPIPEVVVSADDVTHGKPDPEPYVLAASRLGVAPEQCLVVEDAPSGIAAARAAGCAVLAVVTTTPEANLFADLVVQELSRVRFESAPDGLRVHMSGGD